MSIGLESLIYPKKVANFLSPDLPKSPMVVHGLESTIAPIRKIAALKSLDALLRRWPKKIKAHLPDARDESSAVETNNEDARKLFANGMSLLFSQAECLSPVLGQALAAIHRDLGLPVSTYSRCMIYATPDGKGTAAHFDQNINFVLQLKGTKKWALAPNESVLNPMQRHTIGQPIDPELAFYAPPKFPSKMPSKGRIEVILKPGSMLFVPRGYWHSTEATGEALALNFTFSQPTYVDLFTAALRSRLSLSPEWRELADGVTSRDPERRSNAERIFDALLLELVDDLPHWKASDILGATEGMISNPEDF